MGRMGRMDGSGVFPDRPVAVITGASSGIGAATSRRLVTDGFDVVLGARRVDRLAALATRLAPHARAEYLDVTDAASVTAFAATVDACEVVVCNAGGALGVDTVLDGDDDGWRWMWEANVLGVARTVRAFHQHLVASGNGRVVVITSVAGHQVYPNGGGYTSAKHAAAALVDTLRLELLGEPVRFVEIAPGMVDTEFSTVRLGGDADRAAGVYAGMTPLRADDVADAIVWAVTRPAHVGVARIDLFPRDQASARDISRR
jgi:NADP-dependent 3-hydroxy acid dehydrogenase YdfG